MELVDNILKLAGGIIGAVGSASVIIIGLSSWLGKIWANRIYEIERKQHEEDLWYDTMNQMNNEEIPQFREKLEEEFRNLLGVAE